MAVPFYNTVMWNLIYSNNNSVTFPSREFRPIECTYKLFFLRNGRIKIKVKECIGHFALPKLIRKSALRNKCHHLLISD